MRRLVMITAVVAALFVVAVGLSPTVEAKPSKKGPVSAAAEKFDELNAKTQKTLAETARAYFDPEVEFLWKPRKKFVQALAALEPDIMAMKDIPFLRQVVYQGRHFRPPFTDRKWQKDQQADHKKTQGIFHNVKSENWRFTWTTPKSYKDGALKKVPRGQAPLPLLVTLHELEDERDNRGGTRDYPGEAVLSRRFAKSKFGELYDNWFTLAPVAARARFLEDDNGIRHLFLTSVITEFWRRYHVDFDRIVIDGTEPAAALAAAFPTIFAGMILRGGKFEPELVRNFASVPVFVVKDKKLKEALANAGHPDVTEGTETDALVWMNQRRRQVPSSFEWTMTREDHKYANWVAMLNGSPQRTMTVETDRESNTIKITATGVEKVALSLNDDIVDLDKEVKVVVNGAEKNLGVLKRDFAQLFDRDPYVRRSMNFYWLYPVRTDPIDVPEKSEETEPGETEEPTEPADGPKGSEEEEAEAKKWWDKAEEAEKDGNTSKAKAEAKLAQLDTDEG